MDIVLYKSNKTSIYLFYSKTGFKRETYYGDDLVSSRKPFIDIGTEDRKFYWLFYIIIWNYAFFWHNKPINYEPRWEKDNRKDCPVINLRKVKKKRDKNLEKNPRTTT